MRYIKDHQGQGRSIVADSVLLIAANAGRNDRFVPRDVEEYMFAVLGDDLELIRLIEGSGMDAYVVGKSLEREMGFRAAGRTEWRCTIWPLPSERCS
jgi:hypothetical protein